MKRLVLIARGPVERITGCLDKLSECIDPKSAQLFVTPHEDRMPTDIYLVAIKTGLPVRYASEFWNYGCGPEDFVRLARLVGLEDNAETLILVGDRALVSWFPRFFCRRLGWIVPLHPSPFGSTCIIDFNARTVHWYLT